MKTKYTRPTAEVVLIAGGPTFLAASPEESSGLQATFKGYDADTRSGGGFSQDE